MQTIAPACVALNPWYFSCVVDACVNSYKDRTTSAVLAGEECSQDSADIHISMRKPEPTSFCTMTATASTFKDTAGVCTHFVFVLCVCVYVSLNI